MKKMFTVKENGLLQAEENAVYSMFNCSENKYTFFGSDGSVLENYSRTSIQNGEEVLEINDPDFFEEIGEGFYKYTTHEVSCDANGEYDLFGIKHRSGKKLTEEIYRQIGSFCNGLCAVSVEADKWGCIDTEGTLVICCDFSEQMFFNKYGVAVGNNTLIDRAGKEIPDTALNSIDDCGEYNRYYVFSLLSAEQIASIGECGTAPKITVDIYDTKNRAYVIKNVPECRLDVHCFDGEPEVIAAAAELLDLYDSICLLEAGIIICTKDGFVTVYDYYQ